MFGVNRWTQIGVFCSAPKTARKSFTATRSAFCSSDTRGLREAMSLRRLAAIVLSAAAALLVAVVLYLAFGDLSQHKGRIEALVTELLGRPFAIDGAFELKVLPSISVVAERVRLGKRGLGLAAADGRDRARVGADRPLVAGLGTRRRPLVRTERRLGPARDERRRQRQLGVRRGACARAGSRSRPPRAPPRCLSSSRAPSSAMCGSPIASEASRTG